MLVDLDEGKTHVSKLPEQAHQGQEIILAKAGEPDARLVPLAAPRPERRPGRFGGLPTTRVRAPQAPADKRVLFTEVCYLFAERMFGGPFAGRLYRLAQFCWTILAGRLIGYVPDRSRRARAALG